MSRGPILAAVVYAICASGFADDEPAPVSLDVAVQTGLVEVEVKGRGACSGDAVRVEVRRKVSREVRVVVAPGTIMESTSGNVQSMVCHGVKYQKAGDKYRRVDVMVLSDQVPQSFLLEAFCRDFAKPTPGADSSFRIGANDRQTTSVIVKGKANGASLKAIQVAVWLRRGESEQEVRRRFRATDHEFETANALVAAANASAGGDRVAESSAEERVRVSAEGLLKEFLRQREALPFRRGDKVEIKAESAPIRAGQRTIGTAKKGETFEVLAVTRRAARVEFATGAGKPSDVGWIALDHLQLAQDAPRGEGRPLLHKLGELVSETDLEIITASYRGQ